MSWRVSKPCAPAFLCTSNCARFPATFQRSKRLAFSILRWPVGEKLCRLRDTALFNLQPWESTCIEHWIIIINNIMQLIPQFFITSSKRLSFIFFPLLLFDERLPFISRRKLCVADLELQWNEITPNSTRYMNLLCSVLVFANWHTTWENMRLNVKWSQEGLTTGWMYRIGAICAKNLVFDTAIRFEMPCTRALSRDEKQKNVH